MFHFASRHRRTGRLSSAQSAQFSLAEAHFGAFAQPKPDSFHAINPSSKYVATLRHGPLFPRKNGALDLAFVRFFVLPFAVSGPVAGLYPRPSNA